MVQRENPTEPYAQAFLCAVDGVEARKPFLESCEYLLKKAGGKGAASPRTPFISMLQHY